jgi:hypothetical protein
MRVGLGVVRSGSWVTHNVVTASKPAESYFTGEPNQQYILPMPLTGCA